MKETISRCDWISDRGNHCDKIIIDRAATVKLGYFDQRQTLIAELCPDHTEAFLRHLRMKKQAMRGRRPKALLEQHA